MLASNDVNATGWVKPATVYNFRQRQHTAVSTDNRSGWQSSPGRFVINSTMLGGFEREFPARMVEFDFKSRYK